MTYKRKDVFGFLKSIVLCWGEVSGGMWDVYVLVNVFSGFVFGFPFSFSLAT
jgi:hypothetical protein